MEYYLKEANRQPGPVRQFGVPVQFGCDVSFLHKPIVNLPPGTLKVRRRIRVKEMAKVFVKTNDGTVTLYLAGPDGPSALKLLWPIAMNRKETVG